MRRRKEKRRSGRRHTEEGARGEDGDDERLAVGREVVAVLVGRRVGGGVTVDLEPVLHLLDAGDDTGVVTEEDTAKGGEGGHGDAGQLVLGAGHADTPASCNRTTRHDERAR